MFEKLRRDLADARNRGGMRVGLPKVTTDAATVQSLLDRHDRLRAENEALRKRIEYAANYADRIGATHLVAYLDPVLCGEEEK